MLEKEEKIRKEIVKILKERGEKGITVPEIRVPDAREDEIEKVFFKLELEEKVELMHFKDFIREDGGLFSIGIYKLKR